MFDLESLPLALFERIVVRQLAHKLGYFESKMLPKLRKGRIGVLDGIVEDGAQQRSLINHITLNRQHSCDGNRVIDVRGCVRVLTSLPAMLVSRKRDCTQKVCWIQFRKASPWDGITNPDPHPDTHLGHDAQASLPKIA